VAILALAVRSRSEVHDVAGYFQAATQAVRADEGAAPDLADLLATFPTLDRPELLRRLDALVATTGDAAASLGATGVPVALTRPAGYLIVATESWAAATAELRDGMTGILDDPSGKISQERLREAIETFRLGDRAYATFLDSLGEVVDERVPAFPPVVFAAPPGDVDFDPVSITLRLGAAYGLGRHPDLSVTVSTDPMPVGDQGGTPVLPFTDTLTVRAVVVNGGNVAAMGAVVTAEIIPATGKEDRESRRETVDRLEPGDARTVAFEGLKVRPGVVYELVVTVSVEGDLRRDDDRARMVFLMNENR